ncbi:MAG: hypothetical protein ACR2QO_02410 [Acidimicrobiales bacterium]
MTTAYFRVPRPIPRPEDRASSNRGRLVAVGGFGIIAVYLVFFAYQTSRLSYDDWAAYLFAPVLFLVGAPVLQRMLDKVEPDRWIHRVALAGLAAKLVGAFARYFANVLFLGQGDSFRYYTIGSQISDEFRQFVFGGPAYVQHASDITGTSFIRLITATLFVGTGPTHLGGYIIFSFVSFWGLYLFYRAFAIAIPDGHRRRYAVIVFFLPSLVFWPSSIGKEAWMIAMLGVGAYGLSRLLTTQRGAYPLLILSLLGSGVVRPHVAAIFGLAAGLAFLLRRDGSAGGSPRKLLGILVFAALAGVLFNQLQSFFELSEGLDTNAVFEETTRRSSQGGSQFESAQPSSPIELPWAIVTVLFRPLVHEAGGGAGLLTAVEGTFLLGFFVWNINRLVRLPAASLARPYVAFAVLYTLIFCFAFSSIANFGILARQRTQLLPIATVVLAIPVSRNASPHSGSGHDRQDESDLALPVGERIG